MTGESPLPTPAELEVLRLLWERGPSTVREIHEAQRRTRPIGYTTALKLLQNLHDKGLVRRDDARRSHVFESVARRDDIEGRLVEQFIDSVFEGSAGRLVLRALTGRTASEQELAEIRRIADRLDGT